MSYYSFAFLFKCLVLPLRPLDLILKETVVLFQRFPLRFPLINLFLGGLTLSQPENWPFSEKDHSLCPA